MPTIPQKDADIILRQTAKFPRKGDQCNASCVFYAFCANSKDFELCERGFQLINGDSRKLLERTLGTDSVEYIKNSYDFLQLASQNGNLDGVDVVTRELSALQEKAFPEPEETDFAAAMMRGFGNIQGNVSPMAAPNLEEDRREQQYPEICSDGCKFVTCPYRKEENFNLPCKQRWTPLKRSLNPNEE